MPNSIISVPLHNPLTLTYRRHFEFCYSVLGLVSIVSLFDAESRSVAWWGFGFIGLLVLIGSIAGAVRKNNE